MSIYKKIGEKINNKKLEQWFQTFAAKEKNEKIQEDVFCNAILGKMNGNIIKDGEKTPFNGITLEIDINTLLDNKLFRFDSKKIKLFFDGAMEIKNNIEKNIKNTGGNLVKYDKDGWINQENIGKIVEINEEDIDYLILENIEDMKWSKEINNLVKQSDKGLLEEDPIISMLRIKNVAGTVETLPYGTNIITFNSRRHFFRGERALYPETLPTLNRVMKKRKYSYKEKELYRCIANMRIVQFEKYIFNFNIFPFWMSTMGDINIKPLAQHYGLETHLLDLTNDFTSALFFATCKYVEEIDGYLPLTQKDIDEKEINQYGLIYHAPNWVIDYINVGQASMQLFFEIYKNPSNEKFKYIDSGIYKDIAFQIGYQPLLRCSYQSGYVFPMREDIPLQNNNHFERFKFKQIPKLSEKVFEMMEGGKKVFPNEGIQEAKEDIDKIKRMTTFSEDELEYIYDNEYIDRNLFPNINVLKEELEKFELDGKRIKFIKEQIIIRPNQVLLEKVNKFYDNIDLSKMVGGMIHATLEDRKHREEISKFFYGKVL